MKLASVIEELVEERGLDRGILSSIMCEGMAAAYERKYPESTFDVSYDPKVDELVVRVKKEVVSSVQDSEREISLRKARAIDPKAKVGQEVWELFQEPIGRIEILRAKQVIANKIRSIEWEVVYKEFKDKEGSIIHGVIHKCERSGATLKVGDHLAFLPKSLSIPTDKCVVGHSVRALLKEVLLEPRHDNQLILDRTSSEFVKGLFELEIPEVFERIVEIKKIVRAPGYKTKVAVISHDKNIDPVGTCVGVGGVRIKPILRELGTEKIDILAWSESQERLIEDALKPAIVNRVEIIGDVARVWVDEDQRSLAIGKGGQNIALASELVDLNIQLMQPEENAYGLEDLSEE